jgi:2Fe-2S ferredoxin
MYTVTYKFEQKGFPPITLENIEDGQSLLEVALIHDIDLHHNCGGVCACSTCHVICRRGPGLFRRIIDKEEDFIDRAVNPRINSRLGCQWYLTGRKWNIVVTLPDQSQFLGE